MCKTGTDIALAIWVMQPIFPAAMMSGATLAMLAALRARSEAANSGCNML